MSTTWGPEAGAAFRSYVLRMAANANARIESVADLARATQIKPGVYSKWFSGAEQPSVKSLEKLAPVIKAPLRDLLVLACRVRPEDLGLESAPEPPKMVGHPLARELDTLLADGSPLPEVERRSIAAFLDQYLEPYRRSARLRSRGRRNTA
ncbi:helix-turn-helix transcriptional regulator [Micromonospora sp. NBC_01655]|uniref:helix-turn-helix domain-containing protein n=1 Tax=Micromonospora sp. NBC_01655 TaxID=2975983 RepID=UPI002258A98A|nr:helix-turn-helix transcriptional regulator [Micromonospora sp. NBC_01655]MCX4470499.1 helix-turn-helix transcriptional regulator [Micromonospora sp. NBC_01655]